MSKLTKEQFNELQRWIEVRDFCQIAKANLRCALDYANSHNYDSVKASSAREFLDELENTAIHKIRKQVEE